MKLKTLSKKKFFFLITICILTLLALYFKTLNAFIDNTYNNISKKYGFTLNEISYKQEKKFCKNIADLDLFSRYYGLPIFSVPISQIKDKLYHLDCIKNLSISRKFPNKIEVQVTEKQPIAIWQNHNKFLYITENGDVIKIYNPENIENFVVLVGNNAPSKAWLLVELLECNKDIKDHITSAILISDRRWNVLFDNGVQVLLPEDNPEIAWERFVDLAEKHQLMQKSKYKVFDFRVKNKLITK